MTTDKTTTRQIGRCGELLTQYRLLLRGVESALMTTDSGVDLVAYSPANGQAITIQVKTNLKPKRGGGKGKEALDWWVPTRSPAQYVALVNLCPEQIWLLSHAELAAAAQQTSSGRYHFYMYIDSGVKTKTGLLSHCSDFKKYLLENRMEAVFGQSKLSSVANL
jgi:hypothetical protein